jgi:hypothetical protein
MGIVSGEDVVVQQAAVAIAGFFQQITTCIYRSNIY